MTKAALNRIVQGNKESMWSYIYQFTQVIIEFDVAEEGLKCWIFENAWPSKGLSI